MLQVCLRSAAHEGLCATVHEQFLQSLSLPRLYRMAFIPSGSIGLISSDDDLAMELIAMRRHHLGGAPLLLELADMSDGQFLQSQPLPRIVRCDERTTIAYSCRITHASVRSSMLFMGLYEKQHDTRLVAREKEEIVLRLHRLEDFLLLLARCGYSRTQVLASIAYAGLGMSGCTLLEGRADA